MIDAHRVAAFNVRIGRRLLATATTTIKQKTDLRKKSLLVDGNNVLYHFYNQMSTITNGQVKNEAVDGLLRLLRRMDKTHCPEHILVVFDSKQRSIRSIIQPDYKKDRPTTPYSLVTQFSYAKEALTAAGVNCIERQSMEADDIIASYSTQYTAYGFDVLLISNDNDFLQLVHDGISEVAKLETTESTLNDHDILPATIVEIYQPSRQRYVRERNVRGRFRLHPKLLPDFHALCGHQWKKIPRVDHVTDELAVHLLTQYGGLFPLLRHLDTVNDLILRNSLKQCISSIESSFRLVKLVNTVALPVAIEELGRPRLNEPQF